MRVDPVEIEGTRRGPDLADRRKILSGVRWGTATAAYQVEGATAEGGRTPSIWDDFCQLPGAVFHGESGDIACDYYHHWDAALENLRWLGVSVYRFSVSWSRVIPRAGEVNAEGIAYYRRVAQSLREAGISPVVTLYHWDLPRWLESRGGWLAPQVVDQFEFFVRAVVDGLGDLVSDWITVNEPYCVAFHGYLSGMHAPGQRNVSAALRVAVHVLKAHARAVAVLRELVPQHRVGIAANIVDVRPATDSADDVRAADRFDLAHNRLFLSPLCLGRLPDDGGALFGQEVWRQSTGDAAAELAGVDAQLDFFGVNYYTQHVIAGTEAERGVIPGTRVVPATPPTSAHGIGIRPEGFAAVLRRVHNEWTKAPIWICENGIGLHDYVGPDGECRDPERVGFLDGHIDALAQVIAEGVPVEVYLAWALQDNFEWSHGYQLRYGLFYTDFPRRRAIPKTSAHHYRELIGSVDPSRHHRGVMP